MSYDEWDAAQENYIDELLEDFYATRGPDIAEEAIETFRSDRFRSYFVDNPMIIEPARRHLAQARQLLAKNESDAALVFAASAVEIGIKEGLYRPVVHGLLVDSNGAALIIATHLLNQTELDRFKELLFEVLATEVRLDLKTYVHPGGTKKLWDEISETQKRRNEILHRGTTKTVADAEMALRAATAVVETLFPSMVNSLRLHIHEGCRICDLSACKGQP